MLKSMTGFGRFELVETDKKISVEIKSVNHRYFDASIKMPKKFNKFENEIRKTLQEFSTRGKIDVYISYEDMSENNSRLVYNKELAGQYVQCLGQMAENFNIRNELTAYQLSHFPDIITVEEQEMDEEAVLAFVLQAVRGAAEQFLQARMKEGQSLQTDLEGKLHNIAKIVEYVEERTPQIIEAYKQKIQDKVQEFLQDSVIEESRILAEVTLFSDKSCIDEELVRLKSHVKTTQELLKSDEPVGRKLDFIIQEMNREANTILSKSNDLDVSNKGIELKTEIEKVREQIQNVEQEVQKWLV